MAEQREYDVVVYGATGFTGKLIAEYLARKQAAGSESFSFAIAGRNATKLSDVADACVSAPPIIVVEDPASASALQLMTARAAAVVTAVGPFTLYGEPLVAACVATQTHYADTTGEVTWVLDMLEQYGEAAACKGVKLVSCCGMDCIPADLGTLVAMEGLPVPAVKVDINMQTINMLPSGGTMASAAQVGKEMVARGVTSVPYLLTPDAPESLRVDQAVSAKAQQGFGWSEEFNRYTLPWPMALVDNRIVRRSLVLREQPTQVDESLAVEALGRLGLFALRHLPSVMPYLSAKSRPKAGEGPSKAIQQDGGLQMEVEASGSRGERCRVRVCIDGDPGYLCTAAMAAESGLCLALDGASPDLPRLPGGVTAGMLTPSTAMGRCLVRRLEGSGRFLFERTSLSMPSKL